MGENDLFTHKQARTLGKKTSEEEGMLSDRRRTKPTPNQPPRHVVRPPPTSNLDKNGLEWKRSDGEQEFIRD
ncbi:hypothetical protein QJS10_CPB18g00640 [Acorus calamus]|uniref:Uncharacterized protein n=1 Tax=Acorus calamus TaxID=4465 RepID=A0AAV9CNF0_ACOCL|nr:hypothetical protein QJS10_CPB18g00640 [Acorus calamus]